MILWGILIFRKTQFVVFFLVGVELLFENNFSFDSDNGIIKNINLLLKM